MPADRLRRFVRTVSRGDAQAESLVEHRIEVVRIGATAGALVLVLAGGADARSYRSAALVIVLGAVVYTTAMASRFRLRPRVSNAFDLMLSIGVIATTGAGRSIAIGLLFLVLGATALRFSPMTAAATATVGSAATALVILLVPKPDLATGLRIELAAGWSASLLMAAMLVSLLSDLRLQEHEQLVTARMASASLSKADEARRRTLRMVAHDLTAPLVAVDGIARTLQDPSIELDATDRAAALDLLVEHASQLRGFASTLGDVANARELNKLQRHRKVSLGLQAFLGSVCRSQTYGSDREVVFKSGDQLPTVVTDPEKLRRVMVNLIGNALRHSPAERPVIVVAERRGDNVAIAVSDSGSGVDQAHLSEMFEPEWQGSDNVGESGLGLWIVAELVRDLEGTVEASNRPEGGLCVELVIPA